LCQSCETASNEDPICTQTCDRAQACAEETDAAFSGLECERLCAENWEKIESVGCLEICQTEIDCIYGKLEEGICTAKAMDGAAKLCEPESDGCIECIEEEDLDLSLSDITFSSAYTSGCTDYCEKAHECDESGVLTAEWADACKTACEAARDEGVSIVTDEQLACVEMRTCEDFNRCLMGDMEDGDQPDGDTPECYDDGCPGIRLCDDEIGGCSNDWAVICIDGHYNEDCPGVLEFSTAAYGECAEAPCADDEDCADLGVCDDPSHGSRKVFVCNRSNLCERFNGEDPDYCGGVCDATIEASFCTADNVCVCEGGQWSLYHCDDICSSQGEFTDGCGYNPNYGFDYCLCGDALTDGLVGDACAANEDCLTEFCLTTAVISTLTGEEIEIVNGYCCSLSPDICTPDVNGHNVSAAFLGDDYADFNICLAPCYTDADCRPTDDVFCLDPTVLVEGGYLTEEEAFNYFGNGNVCMPQGMLDAMLEQLNSNQRFEALGK